ncbi:hypothetical protein Q7P37_001510 [Cladosporium fusiforme]
MSRAEKTDFISWTKVSRLTYPLYEHSAQQAQVYFDIGEKTIYHGPDDPLTSDFRRQFGALGVSDPFPIAIDPSVIFRVKIDGTVWPDSKHGSIYRLSAKLLSPYTNRQSILVFETFLDWPPMSGVIELHLKSATVNGQPKALPWQLRGELEWTLHNSDNGDSELMWTTTPVEIYVFPANLPAYLNKSGIPLALLRLEEYLPRWMYKASWSDVGVSLRSRKRRHPRPDGIALTWATFAVYTLFAERHIQYEQWDGSYRYVSFGSASIRELFSGDRGFECWLDLWLDERKGYDDRLGLANTSVNCYDLAALCQILVSLGVDTQREKLRMKFMEPFGFIRDTYLIGRFEDFDHPNVDNPTNLCNNPFFGNPLCDQKMLCKADSDGRSSFGNHMFLTLGPRFGEPYVFDACCGPQLGTTSLSEYPSEAIDSLDALYGGYMQPTHPGTVRDILDGPGVESLVICRSFAIFLGSLEQESSTLLSLVATRLRHHGKWEEEYIATPANERSICATWLLRPPAESNTFLRHIITVTVSKYKYGFALENDFNVRLARSAGWSDSPGGGKERCSRDGLGIASRAFKDDEALYLATIRSTEGPDGQCAPSERLKVDLEQVLRDTLALPWAKMQIIEPPPHDLEVHPPDMPQPVGAKIVIGVRVISTGGRRWRGFNVRMAREHVLFLNARQTDGGVLEFQFLARSAGYDTATLTIYSGNLETESKTVNFWVRDEERSGGLVERRGSSGSVWSM